MRYSFYISGNSTRFLLFLEQASRSFIDKIVGVVSEYAVTDDRLLQILRENNIKLSVFDFGDNQIPMSKRRLKMSNFFLDEFNRWNTDYCFSWGKHILSGELLSIYKNRIINFHPSILPFFQGRNAIDQAMEHGNVFLVGNTAHFIDEGVDTGPIIMQSVIPLPAMYTNGSKRYEVVLDMQIEMLNKLIDLLEEDRIVVKENTVYIVGANYNRSIIFPEV